MEFLARKAKWTLLLVALTPWLGACDDVSGPRDGMASVSVFLTDAAGDVETVWVEILGITAQGGEDGFEVLMGEASDLIPLTDLVGTAQLLAADTEVGAATYNQLRIGIGDVVLVTSDPEGTVYVKGDPVLPAGLEKRPLGQLQCPSCAQSGLKVKLPNDEMDVEEGSSAVVFDFDVSQSFGHGAGASGTWVMHPVIHATLVEDSDGDGDVLDELETVKSIRGTVGLGTGAVIEECPEGQARGLADFVPTAASQTLVDGDGKPIMKSGVVAEDGTFQINFLPDGGYDMGYQAALDFGEFSLVFTASVDQPVVSVAGADVEGVTYTIESGECKASS